MEPFILFMNGTSEEWFEEKCFITEILNSQQDPSLSVARVRVELEVTTAWHCLHDTIERYLIESGEGVAEVGNMPPTDVGPGDMVVIPAGVRQRITNTGAHPLIFLALCTPRFRHENYEPLE